MFNIKKIISVWLLSVILSLYFLEPCFASQTFFDNFSNLDNWSIIPADQINTWSVNDGWLAGDIPRKGSSYILLDKIILDRNFDITFDAINLLGIDQEFVFGYDPVSSTRYIVNTRFYQTGWPDGANEVVLWKCSSSCNELKRNGYLGFSLEKNKKYSFRSVLNNGVLTFYIDGMDVLTYSDLSLENVSGQVGFWNWGGDYSAGVSNRYDNFSINLGLPIPTETPIIEPTQISTPTQTPTPTLTPTPTQAPKKKKIFVLPGLGASWNSEAMVYGKQVNNSDWKMTPFVNNYDGVIELMEDNGLKRDEDFYVWNYDWRRSISEIENNFDSFVRSKILSANDEIYLVGHSLGGVVARLWAQDNKSDERIKQVIDLGSPNLGSLETYSVWNGGEILEYNGISSVAFQILLGLQNKSFVISDIDKIRSFAPVAKDLLPTFDYVIKNNKTVSWNSLSFANTDLNNKNSNIRDIFGKLFLSVGVGVSTPKMIKIGSRSACDKALNLWPDGEILGIVKGNGDGTVLENSAGFGSESKTSVTSDHGAITDNSIGLIADKLGLDDSGVSFNFSDNFKDSLVIFVGSPATAKLECGVDAYEEKDGFIVVKGKSYNNCDLSLSPTGNGTVHLVLGNTKNNEWKYLEKEVTLGSEETLKVDFNNVWVADDRKNSDFLKKQIRLDLGLLKLSKAVKYFDNGELTKVALAVFEYRNKNKERVISQRILDNLFDLALIVGPDKTKNKYDLLDNYVDLIETTVNLKSKRKAISKESAIGLAQLKNLEIIVKSLIAKKVYPSYSMVLVMSSGYGAEAVK